MLSYFTVIAGGSSIFMVVSILMTDPVQIATWQFKTPEISQTRFYRFNFIIVDWISALSVWIILRLGGSLEATVAKST